MKKIKLLIATLLISGCKHSPISISSSLVSESSNNISNSEVTNTNSNSQTIDNVSSSISVIAPKEEYTLTFKYVETNYLDELVETEDTKNYTYNYTFSEGYVITENDYDQVYKEVNQTIPNNNGGYYSFYGFYSSLDKSYENTFNVGYKVEKDYTFYFSFVGGPAPVPPTGTFKLTIIDKHNFIFDKPSENESYFAPNTIIKLHSYPILDADLEMYVNEEYHSKQTSVLINDEYFFEFTFIMPIENVTLTFKVNGGI